MTAFAALAVLTVGATGGSLVTYRWHLRRLEQLGYTKLQLGATRWKDLHDRADHHQRRSVWLEARLDHVTTDARDWVGHLLDKVADRDRTIARLTAARHLRRRAMPDYGNPAA